MIKINLLELNTFKKVHNDASYVHYFIFKFRYLLYLFVFLHLHFKESDCEILVISSCGCLLVMVGVVSVSMAVGADFRLKLADYWVLICFFAGFLGG